MRRSDQRLGKAIPITKAGAYWHAFSDVPSKGKQGCSLRHWAPEGHDDSIYPGGCREPLRGMGTSGRGACEIIQHAEIN